jgi:mycoredoxin
MSGSVTMYSTPWCGYCIRLKGQMDREGIEDGSAQTNPSIAQIKDKLAKLAA